MLIIPYVPGTAFKNFPDLDSKLLKHYDLLYDTILDFVITPRYFYETGLKIGFRDMYYYIDQLYNNQPNSIVDVGCGECVWKNWFPNIVGFDPNTNEFSKQDFVDFFDKDFSKGHTKHWDCGMALNSIHFVDWDRIPNQIDLAMNIVKDQFLFTFNFNVISNKPTLPMKQLILLFDQMLSSSVYSIKLLDYPVLRGVSERQLNNWAYANGHVRFILSHKNKDAK
jgi:hypothetical protein